MLFKHYESLVTIDDGTEQLQYSIDEFMLDVPDYVGLPEGMIGRVYDAENRHYVTDGSNQSTDPMDTALLDEYISNVSTYIESYRARNVPTMVVVAYDNNADNNGTPDTLQISCSGIAISEIHWSVVSDVDWLSFTPSSGIVTPIAIDESILEFDATGLEPGAYTGTITVSAVNPSIPDQTFPVTLNVPE